MQSTVIGHVLERLQQVGVADIFHVAGDYTFPIGDAIRNGSSIRSVCMDNELTAAYAADGYARIKGVGALCTTYGVGELSALNGMAGAYAAHLPLFHLVGAPPLSTSPRGMTCHAADGGEYDLFRRVTEGVVCAHAVVTPQNVARETERLIAEARYHRRPVYMAVPVDVAEQPVLDDAKPLPSPRSDPDSLSRAVGAVVEELARARTACVLPGNLVARACQRSRLNAVVEASGLPFATMITAKAVLDEQHPACVGTYAGSLLNHDVRDFVEDCDRVLLVGSIGSDFNLGAGIGALTADLDAARVITIGQHQTTVCGETQRNVEIGDLLTSLASRLPWRDWARVGAATANRVVGEGREPITAEALYPRWANFLRPNDVLVAETGVALPGLAFTRLPVGTAFHNQTLRRALGWASTATLGAAVAAPDRRVVLLCSASDRRYIRPDIARFSRFGLRSTVFAVNNDRHSVEWSVHEDPMVTADETIKCRYPGPSRSSTGDGWFAARVANCADLDDALARASCGDTGAYIEVVTNAGVMDVPRAHRKP